MDLEVKQMKAYYPMMMDLTGIQCMVIGGGQVAERKIASLLEAKAVIQVISPETTEQINAWHQQGLLKFRRKAYERGDGRPAMIVIAATNSAQINEAVCLEAKANRQWVNAVDQPELSNFIVPAIIRRGKLVIAVSTSGASPSAAATIRDEIADRYGAEYEVYLDFLSEFRFIIKQAVDDRKKRQQLMKAILKLDLLERIRQGRFAEFKQELMHRLAEDPVSFEDILQIT